MNKKYNILYWFGISMFIIGITLVLTGAILQQIFIAKEYGFLFADLLLIHWSAWFYLGWIPVIFGSSLSIVIDKKLIENGIDDLLKEKNE